MAPVSYQQAWQPPPELPSQKAWCGGQGAVPLLAMATETVLSLPAPPRPWSGRSKG